MTLHETLKAYQSGNASICAMIEAIVDAVTALDAAIAERWAAEQKPRWQHPDSTAIWTGVSGRHSHRDTWLSADRKHVDYITDEHRNSSWWPIEDAERETGGSGMQYAAANAIRWLAEHPEPAKEKPPLGLMPKWRHDELRLEAIEEAMGRYRAAGKDFPNEWIAERQTLKGWVKANRVAEHPEPAPAKPERPAADLPIDYRCPKCCSTALRHDSDHDDNGECTAAWWTCRDCGHEWTWQGENNPEPAPAASALSPADVVSTGEPIACCCCTRLLDALLDKTDECRNLNESLDEVLSTRDDAEAESERLRSELAAKAEPELVDYDRDKVRETIERAASQVDVEIKSLEEATAPTRDTFDIEFTVAAQAEPSAVAGSLFDLLSELRDKHIPWSKATFGESTRTNGIIKHIESELAEIRKSPGDVYEWIDVMILAMDGAWRCLIPSADIISDPAHNVLWALFDKLATIRTRTYPKPTSDEPSFHTEHKEAAQPVGEAGDLKPQIERWECNECGLPCRLEIVSTDSGYVHLKDKSKFVRRSCPCNETVPHWIKLTEPTRTQEPAPPASKLAPLTSQAEPSAGEGGSAFTGADGTSQLVGEAGDCKSRCGTRGTSLGYPGKWDEVDPFIFHPDKEPATPASEPTDAGCSECCAVTNQLTHMVGLFAPCCIPLDSSLAMLTQIDNVFAGLRKERDELQAEGDRLVKAMLECATFAEAHHGDQPLHEIMHGLTVDIPYMLREALSKEIERGHRRRAARSPWVKRAIVNRPRTSALHMETYSKARRVTHNRKAREMSIDNNRCPKCGAERIVTDAGLWGDGYACDNYDNRPEQPLTCRVRQLENERDRLRELYREARDTYWRDMHGCSKPPGYDAETEAALKRAEEWDGK